MQWNGSFRRKHNRPFSRVLLPSLLLTLLSVPGGVTVAQQQPPPPPNQASTPEGQQIIQREQAFRQALKNKDRTAIDAMTGPTAVFVNPKGIQTKWEYMSTTLSQLTLENQSMSNIQVRLPGADTRIIIYQVNQSGTLAGQPLPATGWVTSAWYNQNGNWLMVCHQVTPAG